MKHFYTIVFEKEEFYKLLQKTLIFDEINKIEIFRKVFITRLSIWCFWKRCEMYYHLEHESNIIGQSLENSGNG